MKGILSSLMNPNEIADDEKFLEGLHSNHSLMIYFRYNVQ